MHASATELWAWFERIADELAANYDTPLTPLAAELGRRITALGLWWEVGPDKDGGLMLAISPGRHRDRMPEVRAVVAAAPSIAGWTFHAGKPPKLWTRMVIEVDGHRYDATTWRYVLSKYADGVCDIVVEQNNVASEHVRDLAAALIIEGILGEDARWQRFERIEAVHRLDPAVDMKGTSIEHLAAHLAAIQAS
jgi:hypothetical protein